MMRFARVKDPQILPEGVINAGLVLKQPDALNRRIQVLLGTGPTYVRPFDREEIEEMTVDEYRAAIVAGWAGEKTDVWKGK